MAYFSTGQINVLPPALHPPLLTFQRMVVKGRGSTLADFGSDAYYQGVVPRFQMIGWTLGGAAVTWVVVAAADTLGTLAPEPVTNVRVLRTWSGDS